VRCNFTEDHEAPFRIEDYLREPRGIMAIQLLVEDCSIRTVERITGLHRDAIMRLLLAAGQRCERLKDALIQDVPARDVQADEIWSFVGKKEKNTTSEDSGTLGDSYCWIAIEARTKLVLSFVVGKRSVQDAIEFTQKLRRATSPTQRFQLTTDGLCHYVTAVGITLHDRCDFAQPIKIYTSPDLPVETVPIVTGNSVCH
jgi:IS1 family transposase